MMFTGYAVAYKYALINPTLNLFITNILVLYKNKTVLGQPRAVLFFI